jgi:hypothetical protein
VTPLVRAPPGGKENRIAVETSRWEGYVTTVGVTGHIDLTDATTRLVRDALRAWLAEHADGGLTGVSCMAAGADLLFGETVLEAGGRLVAVVPSRDYRQRCLAPPDAAVFDRLVAAAAEVHVVPYERACRDAYQAANKVLLARADRLVAVWDGGPPRGRGGTGEVVRAAREAGLPVDVLWPDGAARAGGRPQTTERPM